MKVEFSRSLIRHFEKPSSKVGGSPAPEQKATEKWVTACGVLTVKMSLFVMESTAAATASADV